MSDLKLFSLKGNKGHWGTGDLLVDVRTAAELERAKVLILKSYENA